jgi:4-amino-4-deoxy-L-arabinose transferase-like glycosyltransferase
VLLLVSLVVLTAKGVTAWTTTGTDDALFWDVFARTVRDVGPVDIYAQHLLIRYNHPPPMGWLLVGLNWLTNLGLPFRFLIRLPASLADVGSTFLVFELLRRRTSPRTAVVGAAVVAVSPVLFVVSGFHGNTDSVFVFFVLLAVWLLVDRDRPIWAGVAIAAAVGVKLVPVVVVPALLAAAVRRGRGSAFAATAGAAVLVSWLPAVSRQYPVMRANVIGYAGHTEDYGLVLVLRRLGAHGLVDVLAGPGRYVVLAAAALPAAYWAWRRPDELPAATGLTLVSFLALSPAYASQYLAWPVAAGALLSPMLAAAYSAVAGVLLVVLYTEWSRGFPWDWAHPRPATPADLVLRLAVWVLVAAWTVYGLRRLRIAVRHGSEDDPADQRVVAGRRGDHEDVEDLVVAEHVRSQVEPAPVVGDRADRVEHAAGEHE